MIMFLSAMQNECKVVRLEAHAIDVYHSYIMAEMSPDAVLPHLVDRRLLSSSEAAEVVQKSSKPEKSFAIIKKIKMSRMLGALPTFCAALRSAQQTDIADTLSKSKSFYAFTFESVFVFTQSSMSSSWERLSLTHQMKRRS